MFVELALIVYSPAIAYCCCLSVCMYIGISRSVSVISNM